MSMKLNISPVDEERQSNSTRQEQEIPNENKTWKSFCLQVDKDMVTYISAFTIVSGVTCFCCYQLVNLQDCHSQSLYSGLLGTMIGLIFSKSRR